MEVKIGQRVEVVEGYYKGIRGRVTALYMDSSRVELTYPHPEAGIGKVNPGHEVRCDVWSTQLAPERPQRLGDVPVDDINGALAFRAERQERCPVCGGLNPGDITHTRC